MVGISYDLFLPKALMHFWPWWFGSVLCDHMGYIGRTYMCTSVGIILISLLMWRWNFPGVEIEIFMTLW